MNALILGLALIAEAAPLSVSELLTNADRFNAQSVTVSGSMSRLREHFTSSGTRYYTFRFGDNTQTVLVISYEKPQCQAGAATVEGTFDQVKWRARRATRDLLSRQGTTARALRLRPSSLNPPPRVDQLRQRIQLLSH